MAGYRSPHRPGPLRDCGLASAGARPNSGFPASIQNSPDFDMATVATNLKRGQCINYKGETGVVLGLEHRTPGKGNALIMATIRSFNSGKTKDIRFASNDKVEIVQSDRQKLEFSYKDQVGYHFMDTTTFDTITFQEDFVEYV